jgi:hypothetical protein
MLEVRLKKISTATFIALIPKKIGAFELKDFRPISLLGNSCQSLGKHADLLATKMWFWREMEANSLFHPHCLLQLLSIALQMISLTAIEI